MILNYIIKSHKDSMGNILQLRVEDKIKITTFKGKYTHMLLFSSNIFKARCVMLLLSALIYPRNNRL